ncbi:AAA family ATPase [Clostridium paraputrificum]|nr:AAA family ATPase [Clostridium paraputrificum]
MSYLINRIYIENFKFINSADICFNQSNLVILDGPNGYGKTTIFDIIELAITGKISRIDSNQTNTQAGCQDILYLKDQNKNAIVKVEFISDTDKFTIVKTIDSTKSYGRIQKRSNNWDLFDTYLIDDFDQEYKDDNIVDKNKVIEKFEDYDIDRYYDLLYYVQQEESTSFLKRSEKDRVEVLSKLFDTKKEEEELKKIQEFKKRIRQHITKLEKDKKEEIKISEEEKIKQENVNYKRIISKKDCEWDRENIIVKSEKQKEYFIGQVSNVKVFIENFSSFLSKLKNEKIDFLLDDKDIIKSYIICKFFYDEYSIIEQKYEDMKFVLDSKKLFENITIESLKKVEYSKLFKKLNIKDQLFDEEKYEDLLEELMALKNNESNLAEAIRGLNSSRSNLYKKNKGLFELEGSSKINSSKCILCGNEYLNSEELKEQIDSYTDSLNVILDDSQKTTADSINAILNLLSENMIMYIDNYIEKEKSIDAKFYNQLKKYINKYKANMGVNNYIKEFNVDLDEYINKEYTEFNKIDEICDDIHEYLSSQKENITIEYQILEKEIRFKNIYKDIFDNTYENVKNIDIRDLEEKQKYIEYKYYMYLLSEQEDIKKHNDNINLKIDKLDNLYKNEIKGSIDVYNKCISKHRSNIIKDIEIPFYIYTGKIIQDYQRGLGIFIKEYEEFKNLKFVSNANSDHDAINCLSSGQLSALVISFTLALNKVYGKKKLGFILIDDPLQSMDDMNMISFMELMRNEFLEKQIVM